MFLIKVRVGYLTILVNFEPSKVRLNINPLLLSTKPTMGSLISIVLMSSPTPHSTTATEPSTPAFHPLLFLKLERALLVKNTNTIDLV